MSEEIKIEQLTYVKNLGNGNYSEFVSLYTHEKFGEVAVKKIKLLGSASKQVETIKGFKKESKVFASLKCKNIIRVIGTTKFCDGVGLVMEYAKKGNLEDYLSSGNQMPLFRKLQIMIEIANALVYLHEGAEPIVHGDVKPQNILVMDDDTIKFCDFGSCNVLKAKGAVTTTQSHPSYQYTLVYAAPEFLANYKIRRCTKEDVYGFSMVSYEVLTGKSVYKVNNVVQRSVSRHVLEMYICRGGRPDEKFFIQQTCETAIEKHVWERLVDQVKVCWNGTPTERPTMSKVKEELIELAIMMNKDYNVEQHIHALPLSSDSNPKEHFKVSRKRASSAPPHSVPSKSFNANADRSHKKGDNVNNSNTGKDMSTCMQADIMFIRLKQELCKSYVNLAETSHFCPKLYTVPDYYEQGIFVADHLYTPSNSKKCHSGPFSLLSKVGLHDILPTTNSCYYTAIIGPPGCGKTTCSLKLAISQNYVCFFSEFSFMNGLESLSLKQFVVDLRLHAWSQTEKDDAFKWVVSNPEKCVFIFDGYDLALQKLQTPLMLGDTTVTTVSHLVSGLCSQKLLPGAKIVLTSRPYAINDLSGNLRPQKVIYVQQHSSEDAKKLYDIFTNSRESADEVWHSMIAQFPQLLGFCCNPLLLKYLVKAILPDCVSTSPSTMTDMIGKLLQLMAKCKHFGDRLNQQLLKTIGELAFSKTEQKSSLVTNEDLEKLRLHSKTVQDFLTTVVGKPQNGIFGSNLFSFFNQDLWQEFLSAYYCCFLSMENFEKAAETCMTSPVFCMVRRFLCGLLLGTSKFNDLGLAGDDMQQKENILLKKMQNAYQNCEDKTEKLEIMIDLLEADDKNVMEFAKLLPADVDFSNVNIKTNGFHALSKMLQHTEQEVSCLDLTNTCPSALSLHNLCHALTRMKHKIKTLKLSLDKLEEQCVSILQDMVPFILKELFLHIQYNKWQMPLFVQADNEYLAKLSQTRDQKNPKLEMRICCSVKF